jgi:hypothetical protein
MKNTNPATKKSQVSTHAFSTRKHPVFGRGVVYSDLNPPEGVKRSPYYWWFKFLQLSDDYQKAFEGKRSKVSKEIVRDFGNVRDTSFKAWWIKRVDLFAEPPLAYRMTIATNLEELAPFNSAEAINLVIPLNWTNVGIKRSFARVIDRLVPKLPRGKSTGKTAPKSEAKYRLGRKWNISGFEYAHKIYLARQQADLVRAATGKKVPWADVAISAGLPIYQRYLAGKTVFNKQEIRKVITVMAQRHYKKAEQFIKAAASRSFPQ